MRERVGGALGRDRRGGAAARRCRLAGTAVLVLLAALGTARATGVLAPFERPLEPPEAGGVSLVDRLLAKLSTHQRLLVIGAHPDDEDTALLALVARARGGEAAYLSLSRGEGGQNLIGSELGPALGLLRSRELLAARHVDGARQFFSRAYDFGYTRSLDETLRFWPEPVLLEDAVRVIRRFRPQVVVAVFPPDERAGHGQHQASGRIAGEAVERSGDAGAFPDLAADGLAPWRPAAFYRNTWWDPDATTVTEPTGVLDPLTGRSILQIALASRSLHRSQDMGMLQPLGPGRSNLGWVWGGAGAAGDDLFSGIDTHLPALVASLPEGPARRDAGERLARVEELARRTRARLAAADLAAAAPPLAEIVTLLREARRLAGGDAPDPPDGGAARDLVTEKLDLARTALAAAAGVAIDAVADRAAVAPGDGWRVDTLLWAPGGVGAGSAAPVELRGVELVSPAGLDPAVAPAPVAERTGWAARFQPNADPAHGFWVSSWLVTVPAAAPPTVPYFLERPLRGDLYDWSAAPPAVRGEPFGPPPLVARFRVAIAGVEVVLEREVADRTRDQAVGEVRAPLRVVPAVEVGLSPDRLVWPTARRSPRRLHVTLTSHAEAPLAGRLEVAVPEGWPAVPPQPFSLAAAGTPGDDVELTVAVAPPERFAAGTYAVHATAVVTDAAGAVAGRYAAALPLVDYPHVRATPVPEPAVAAVAAADIRLPPLSRVGYVRGAADRVPELLAEVGVPVVLLDADALTESDLSGYDAIVIGSRAYEVDPALGRANPRLLDYARRGGLVIVQYQQYPWVEGGFPPYPLEIARPHDRITDETAPVRALVPDHPVFHVPNEIGPADWEGWVQERGLYFPHTWDERYRPLLAMTDPGQPEQRGALLVAPVGAGTYVYTGLAFFRQLPAGVPGAYRLFANLLALGAGAPGSAPGGG